MGFSLGFVFVFKKETFINEIKVLRVKSDVFRTAFYKKE